MTKQERRNLLRDHGDMRMVATELHDSGLERNSRDALEFAHQQYACDEYLECVKKLELPRDRIHFPF